MQDSRTFVHQGKDFSLAIYLDPFNRRLRVDDYLGNLAKIITYSESLVTKYKVEKLIVKAKPEHFKQFIENGYTLEGVIDGYFLGSDCLFFSKFFTLERRENIHWRKEDEIVHNVRSLRKEKPRNLGVAPTDYKLKKLTETDVDMLANLYNQVFQIYPTPLNNPQYIKETMEAGTIYYGFEYKGEIVSAASAEMNFIYKNAELTDCATVKKHRKYGLMKFLLVQLENELKEKGIYCAYSIARSLSFGMNAALHHLGYVYRGRLHNNCYIFDKLEDMNLWVKDLSTSPE